MVSFLNKVMIIGNVGRDPEMSYMPSGDAVTKFSVAVNRIYNTQDGQRKEETEWFNVVAWKKLAELCDNYVTKGQKVYVEGRFQSRSWQSPDGQKHKAFDVVANTVIFLSKPKGTAVEEETIGGGEEIEPGEIPF